MAYDESEGSYSFIKVPQMNQPWAWPGIDDNLLVPPVISIVKYGYAYVIYDNKYILFGGF